MKVKKVETKVILCLFVLACLIGAFSLAIAGDLEPSAPPAPTMKTLDEVEPRIPINQADIPKTILSPGSYYLIENLLAVGISGTHVIEIAAHNVTLDLKGFTITGSNFETVSADSAVLVTKANAKNILIKNGVVRFCTEEGIDAIQAQNSQILNIRAYSNTDSGIVLGSGGLVSQCVVESNSGGIRVGVGSTVLNCVAKSNSGSWAGIYTNNQCLVIGCTASENNNHGIRVGADSSVTNSTASNNTGNGIFAAGSLVSGNSASRNTGDGIKVSFNSLVINNICALNNAAGIHATDGGNRIESNHVPGNNRGIDVDASLNLIVRNSSIGGSPEFDITGGNKAGATSTNPATAGPWDNFDL